MIRTMTIRRAVKIARKFQANGFNVRAEAIMFNFEGYMSGGKTGYRDEKNGYHLFTPCKGNTFSLRATMLEPCCSDWQKTYVG